MKAVEAKIMADTANTGTLEEVYKVINEAAKKGEYITHLYFRLLPKQINELRENGFDVTDVTDRNETCICISWEKTNP